MEIKYTTDNKKVVIIGNLNSQEKIVQEIFIDGSGNEIPSGENFVVKSLHDTPVISWREKRLIELENEVKQKTDEIEDLRNKYNTKASELREKLSYTIKALGEQHNEQFQTLIDFICGKISWIVIENWCSVEILPIDEFNVQYDNRLRLMSIYGKDDGSFTYAVGDYHDHSGGSRKFHPFKSYEEAFIFFETTLIDKGVSESNLKMAEKYGIKFPKEDVLKYKEKRSIEIKNEIERNTKTITSYEEQLLKLSQLGNE